MGKIYHRLVPEVSQTNKKRVEELLRVLDPSSEYTIKKTKSPAMFNLELEKLNSDRSIVLLDIKYRALQGDLRLYPKLQVDLQSFAVILVKRKFIQNGESKQDATIIVYEKVASIGERMRGAMSVNANC